MACICEIVSNEERRRQLHEAHVRLQRRAEEYRDFLQTRAAHLVQQAPRLTAYVRRRKEVDPTRQMLIERTQRRLLQLNEGHRETLEQQLAARRKEGVRVR